MNDWVVGYRMRFDVVTQLGDIRLEHYKGGKRCATLLDGLGAASFVAVATLLANAKQRVLFDGKILDSGPEAL